ncbi:MarR family transcriptional regulator [Brucella sp. BE17]|uniref:MarR family winged helix-turn-helix transcriptional regulator n=1 Tax=Brucella sp. BE17 TaxID=3142977 RepID=UPI0031BBA495
MITRSYDPDSFGFLITDIARLYRAEFDRRIAQAGLKITPAEARTLVHVARQGPLRQAILAERMGIEAMTLSGHLDRLEARAMIRREAASEDRRTKQVHLTAAGTQMLDFIHQISGSIRGTVSDMVAPEEWDGLNRALKSIRNDLVDRTRNRHDQKLTVEK